MIIECICSLKDAIAASDETREFVANQPLPGIEPQYPKEVSIVIHLIQLLFKRHTSYGVFNALV